MTTTPTATPTAAATTAGPPATGAVARPGRVRPHSYRSPLLDPAEGRLLHPGVHHYRDGGMGGLGEDHTVVGFVRTEVLEPYRHHDGTWDIWTAATGDRHHLALDLSIIDDLRAALRDGTGFHTPLMLEYDHRCGWAYLGEGNHRLAAARAEGTAAVPVRVVRSTRPNRYAESHIGAATSHHPIPGANRGYIPSDLHPSYLTFDTSRA